MARVGPNDRAIALVDAVHDALHRSPPGPLPIRIDRRGTDRRGSPRSCTDWVSSTTTSNTPVKREKSHSNRGRREKTGWGRPSPTWRVGEGSRERGVIQWTVPRPLGVGEGSRVRGVIQWIEMEGRRDGGKTGRGRPLHRKGLPEPIGRPGLRDGERSRTVERATLASVRSAPGLTGNSTVLASALLNALRPGPSDRLACEPFAIFLVRTTGCWKEPTTDDVERRSSTGNTPSSSSRPGRAGRRPGARGGSRRWTPGWRTDTRPGTGSGALVPPGCRSPRGCRSSR